MTRGSPARRIPSTIVGAIALGGALAIAVTGCAPESRAPESAAPGASAPESAAPGASAPEVPLLTGGGLNGHDGVGCYTWQVDGDLVVDPIHGTAVIGNGARTPVRWPLGYTARRAGSEVEVLDETGAVVVRTGTRVHLGGGGDGDPWAWVACVDPADPPRTLGE